jgi:hypothetical protein
MRPRDEEFSLCLKLDPRRSDSRVAPAPKQFLNTYEGIDLCDRSNLAVRLHRWVGYCCQNRQEWTMRGPQR